MRASGRDAATRGLVATDPGHGQPGRAGAPVSRPDARPRAGHGHGLGPRGHQRHHPARRTIDRHIGWEVIDDCHSIRARGRALALLSRRVWGRRDRVAVCRGRGRSPRSSPISPQKRRPARCVPVAYHPKAVQADLRSGTSAMLRPDPTRSRHTKCSRRRTSRSRSPRDSVSVGTDSHRVVEGDGHGLEVGWAGGGVAHVGERRRAGAAGVVEGQIAHPAGISMWVIERAAASSPSRMMSM